MALPLSPTSTHSGDNDDDEEAILYKKLQARPPQRTNSTVTSMADAEPTFSLKELKNMKHLFEDYPDGMDTEVFVRLVGPEFFRLSPSATNRDIEVLFKRIDANANGSVDWDEFSAFLLMNDVKSTLKLTAEAKSNDYATAPTTKEAQLRGHHALRHVFHKEPIHRILIHHKYPKYFTASDDGMVKVWNAESLRHMQTLQAASHAAVSDLQLTPWFDTIAATAMDNTISFYSCDTGDLVRCYKGERGSRIGGRLRSGEMLFDDRTAVVRRPQFAIPVNKEEGEDIKYGRTSHLFGKVETAVPVLEHFKKPREVPAITLSNFGAAEEGRHHVPVQAGYPTAINVCNIRNEMQMLIGFDNGYMQWYPLSGGSQGPANTVGESSTAVFEVPKNTIKMHWDYVSKIIAVPQMDLLLSASYDGMIQVRPFDRIEEVTTLLGEGIVVNDHKSGGLLGTSSVVRDTSLYGHSHRVTGMDWNYESRLLVSCAPERDALIWSPYIPKPITRLLHPRGTVKTVQFMKSNDQILTMSTDNVVRLWDVRTYRCVQTLEDHHSGETLSCARFDGRRECVVLGSQCLRRWGLVQSSEYHRKYTGHRRPVIALVVSLPFRQVITADHKIIVVWNMDNGQEAVMRWEVEGTIADICLDSNCRRLFVATLKGPILVYNYVNGLLLKTYNAGGVSELQKHFALQKAKNTSEGLNAGEVDAAPAPGPTTNNKFLASGDPEVVAVRFADVSKPRPTSVILSTLDDGMTAVFLDEEGGEVAPFRTLRVNSASLTSLVDTGYNLLILGHHAGISVCSLDEATTAVTPVVRLTKEAAKLCKVALFVGSLVDEPIADTSRYLQHRDEMVMFGHQQKKQRQSGSSIGLMTPTTTALGTAAPSTHRQLHNTTAPSSANAGSLTPSKQQRTTQSLSLTAPSSSISQEVTMSLPQGPQREHPSPSKVRTGMEKAGTTANMRRRSSVPRFLSNEVASASANSASQQQPQPPVNSSDAFTADLNQQHMQSLGLVEKIVILSSVEPHIIITGSADGLLQFWDGRALNEILRFRATPVVDAITSLNLNYTEDALLVGDNSGYVSIFDMSPLIDECSDRMMSMVVGHTGVAPLPPPVYRPDMIQLKVRFRAHNESISSIGLDEGIALNGTIPGFHRRRSVAASYTSQSGTGNLRMMSQHEQRMEQQRAMHGGEDNSAFGEFESVDAFVVQPRRERKQSTVAGGRKRSLFIAAVAATVSSPTARVPTSNNSSPKKADSQSSLVCDAPITPDGTHVKVYTSSADTYSYVWLMNRRSCEVQLVSCLGDPIFKPTLPRHHPQVLYVFDTTRIRLIHRYMSVEGKSTWAMILAHFARVVESRRVSLFSANSAGPNVLIPYLNSFDVLDAEDDDMDPLASDDDDDDGEDEDDFFTLNIDAIQQSRGASSAALSVASAKPLPTFERMNTTTKKQSTVMIREASTANSRVKRMERSAARQAEQQPLSGRKLLKDVPYQKQCRQSFDRSTHDDISLETLLRRLLMLMVDGGSGHESCACVDAEGFYYATSPTIDVIPPKDDAARGSTMKRASERVSMLLMASPDKLHSVPTASASGISHARPNKSLLNFTAISGGAPTPGANNLIPQQLGTRSRASLFGGEDATLSESMQRGSAEFEDEIVEITRPPRHQVRYSNTADVRDPPDISEVLASETAPKTVLVGSASKFTGVRSVNRNSEVHPFVSTEMLAQRGEAGYAASLAPVQVTTTSLPPVVGSKGIAATPSTTPRGTTSSSEQPPAVTLASSLQTVALVPMTPSKIEALSLPGTPRTDKKVFMTEVEDRHAFMKSVMSYSTTSQGPSATPGSTGGSFGVSTSRKSVGLSTSPRMPSRGGLGLLYNDATFVLPTPPTFSLEGLHRQLSAGHIHGKADPTPIRDDESPSRERGLMISGGNDDVMMLPHEALSSIPRLITSAPQNNNNNFQLTIASPRTMSVTEESTRFQECRQECEALDAMLQFAHHEREEMIASSRRFLHGARPTWEASELLQRRMKRQEAGGGNTGGNYVLVQSEDQQQKLRQLRSVAGGRHHRGHRRAQFNTVTAEDKEKQQKAHLDLFHKRAVVLVGEDVVTQRTLDMGSDASLGAGGKKGMKNTDEDRRSTDDLEDPGGEILGDLQWVSRLHSRLEVPRTFSLVPMPPSVDAARNAENQRMKLLKEADADHGWIRMLSTARGRKAEAVVRNKRASPGSGNGLHRTASARSTGSSNSPTASVVAPNERIDRRTHSKSPKKSRPQSQSNARATTTVEPVSPKKNINTAR